MRLSEDLTASALSWPRPLDIRNWTVTCDFLGYFGTRFFIAAIKAVDLATKQALNLLEVPDFAHQF